MANNPIPLSAKRNRSGRCPIKEVHAPHDDCPGRIRAAKTDRCVDAAVLAEIEQHFRTFGGLHIIGQADRSTLGFLPAEAVERYSLDLESYQAIDFSQKDKFASFFTVVKRTNAIVLEYAAQDLLPLTVRQIFYQHVVRFKDFANTGVNYKHLAIDLVDARLAGCVPWNGVADPSRDLHQWLTFASVRHRLESAAWNHRLNRWRNQDFAPLVLVEKDAALGVISRACDLFYVPYLSCKGYGSLTALRNDVARYCLEAFDRGQEPVVIHLSDHDSSGWDMPRNLDEYMQLLCRRRVDVRHVVLTPDQIIEGYGDGNPLPPDPVKDKDPRSPKYVAMLAERGLPPGAWEMDALPPAVLHDVIVNEVESLRDKDRWQEIEDEENAQKAVITKMAEDYQDRSSESLDEGLRAMQELLDECA